MGYKQNVFEHYASAINAIAAGSEATDPDAYRTLGACAYKLREHAATDHARYEALRVMNPKDFAEIWARALLGERFDDMVDELVKAKDELK